MLIELRNPTGVHRDRAIVINETKWPARVLEQAVAGGEPAASALHVPDPGRHHNLSGRNNKPMAAFTHLDIALLDDRRPLAS